MVHQMAQLDSLRPRIRHTIPSGLQAKWRSSASKKRVDRPELGMRRSDLPLDSTVVPGKGPRVCLLTSMLNCFVFEPLSAQRDMFGCRKERLKLLAVSECHVEILSWRLCQRNALVRKILGCKDRGNGLAQRGLLQPMPRRQGFRAISCSHCDVEVT